MIKSRLSRRLAIFHLLVAAGVNIGRRLNCARPVVHRFAIGRVEESINVTRTELITRDIPRNKGERNRDATRLQLSTMHSQISRLHLKTMRKWIIH